MPQVGRRTKLHQLLPLLMAVHDLRDRVQAKHSGRAERTDACSRRSGHPHAVGNAGGQVAEEESGCRAPRCNIGSAVAAVGANFDLVALELAIERGTRRGLPLEVDGGGVQESGLHLGRRLFGH